MNRAIFHIRRSIIFGAIALIVVLNFATVLGLRIRYHKPENLIGTLFLLVFCAKSVAAAPSLLPDGFAQRVGRFFEDDLDGKAVMFPS